MNAFSICFGALTCALGSLLSTLCNDKNKPIIRKISLVCTIIFAIAAAITYNKEAKAIAEAKERNADLFLYVCHNHFENEEYEDALASIFDYRLNDAESCMVYAYFLANGYGVEKNIPSSIEHYDKAAQMGEPRALSNMLISVIKNCDSKEKIEIIKSEYDSGNEIAVRFIDHVISSWNSNPETSKDTLSTSNIWQLEEAVLLDILNGPFYQWIRSSNTSDHFEEDYVSERYTRKLINSTSTSWIYEECFLIADNDFPGWLQEDIW